MLMVYNFPLVSFCCISLFSLSFVRKGEKKKLKLQKNKLLYSFFKKKKNNYCLYHFTYFYISDENIQEKILTLSKFLLLYLLLKKTITSRRLPSVSGGEP